MEIFQQIIQIFKKIPKDYYLPIFLGCIGLILFGYGIYTKVYLPQFRENSTNSDFSQSANPSIGSGQGKNSGLLPATGIIKVDVEGAVVSPGVYAIAADARVQDGLVAAGGLSEIADRVWVSQHVNLALKLTDGTKIYIPNNQETIQDSGFMNQAGNTGSTDIMGAQSQQIDINSASSSDLDSLPGIGQVTAQKIIAGRPYASTQDLETKKIVGPKEFDKIKGLIVVQ